MPRKVGIRVNIPYLQGAFLALNAVPDAYFLGDGPSCLFAKGERIHGRHDLFSTLLSCDNEHRIQHTGINVFNIAGNFEGEIAAAIRRITAFPSCGVVFMGSMPMCAIAGTDYERILREALTGSGKPAFVIPRRSAVSGDWLDGYAGVLEALASGMDLGGAKPLTENVALVGYMMDRNEGEHFGNLSELERMVRALGLNPVSIWLSGRPFEELREARRAGTIVSLPYGRKAAQILARRLGVPLVEAGLPFGLEASRRFMEQLGRAFGREAEAEAFIQRELDQVAPRLEWSVPHAFLRRRFAFIGDPHLALGFAEQIEGLGGEIAGMVLMGGVHHLTEAEKKDLNGRPGTAFEPLEQEMESLCGDFRRMGLDLMVGSGLTLRGNPWELKYMEFGFPSDYTHFLRDEPFLGFQGALAFLSRVANEVTRSLRLDLMKAPQGEEEKHNPSGKQTSLEEGPGPGGQRAPGVPALEPSTGLNPRG